MEGESPTLSSYLQIITLFLNMLNISEQSLEGVVFIINSCKLLTIFQRGFKKPIKVDHIQELANQSRFNGVLEIEMINNSFTLDICREYRQSPFEE